MAWIAGDAVKCCDFRVPDSEGNGEKEILSNPRLWRGRSRRMYDGVKLATKQRDGKRAIEGGRTLAVLGFRSGFASLWLP